MSDEEKKAYDNLIMLKYFTMEKEDKQAIDTILKLIEKQSKEIEELKEDNKHQWEERCKLTFELENSTSKDKIKEKIEEIKKDENPSLSSFQEYAQEYSINKLQELLKERS